MNIAVLDMDNLKNPHWAGGQARLTREVFMRLAKKHVITVYSSKYPGYQDYVEDGISYVHVGVGANNSKINNLLYVLMLPLTTRSIKQADLIIECFNAPMSTTCTQLFTKIPVIGYATFFFAKELSRKYKLPFYIIENLGLKAYRFLIGLNDADAKRMKEQSRKALVTVIPEGVDDEYFTIKRQTGEYLLCLGRFDVNQKGIDLLLDAYQKVYQKLGLPLIIAGRGPDEALIKTQIKKLGLDKQVTVLGPTYGDAKRKVLAKAAVVCIPSRTETFCGFALEALAAGIPIAAFDISALSWLSPTVSYKAKPYDLVDYGQGLISLAKQSSTRISHQRCQAFAKQFTWDAVADQFDRYLHQVAKTANKPIAAKVGNHYAKS